MYSFAALDPFTSRAGRFEERVEDLREDFRDRVFTAFFALRPRVDDLVCREEDLVKLCCPAGVCEPSAAECIRPITPLRFNVRSPHVSHVRTDQYIFF